MLYIEHLKSISFYLSLILSMTIYISYIRFITIFLYKKKLDKIYLSIYKFFKNILTTLWVKWVKIAKFLQPNKHVNTFRSQN